MDDKALADEIIERLNKLIEDEAVRKALESLCLRGKVEVGEEVADHPTIQVLGKDDEFRVGFLGMLNGVVGSISGGELDRCGYIAAVYDKPAEDSPTEDFILLSFKRFDKDAV